jgi:hypothetical protein
MVCRRSKPFTGHDERVGGGGWQLRSGGRRSALASLLLLSIIASVYAGFYNGGESGIFRTHARTMASIT